MSATEKKGKRVACPQCGLSVPLYPTGKVYPGERVQASCIAGHVVNFAARNGHWVTEKVSDGQTG